MFRSKQISHKFPLSKQHSGFSLAELLVSIGIVLLIAGVLLTRYSAFNSTVVLKNLAFDIALSIREAQVLSVSVLGSGDDAFRGVYGVYFDLATPDTYILFQDLNEDRKYDDDEDFEEFVLNNNFEIVELCHVLSSDRNCLDDDNEEIAVTFKRPDFDAFFDIGNDDLDNGVSQVEIVIVNTTNPTIERRVIVTTTGQVSVE